MIVQVTQDHRKTVEAKEMLNKELGDLKNQ